MRQGDEEAQLKAKKVWGRRHNNKTGKPNRAYQGIKTSRSGMG